MSSRIHSHHSLPAPVVHAAFSVAQSKSNVLAGVQDAYWSDDEGEDAECPLCLEEMDISDLNFKPCICGYQICRFCWHHIKENLNGRCPACRRVYTDDAVEFKPIAKEDHKRLTQQKKQRERERKELDALGRRQLANVRVVQRNVVYVVGIGPRFAKEELIPTLRSNEYFGQYGKITKILLVKRTPSGGGAPVVGLYITYNRREDAARAIAAVDGIASPGGGRDVMRASYGTTKYCMAFLRGVTCGDHGCMNLHEWGDEKDCFTKEDLTTLKHTMKATESRSRNAATGGKKAEEPDGLPRASAWAHKGSAGNPNNHSPSTSASRQTRRGGLRQPRNSPAPVQTTPSDYRLSSTRTHQDRKTAGTAKNSSSASLSRPSTPAAALLPQRPATPADVKALRLKKASHSPQPSRSPAPSVAAESDQGSGSHDVPPSSLAVRPQSTDSAQSSVPSIPLGIPIVPPGLSVPPGIPTPSRPPRVETASPQTPLLASQSSYQMSTAARALLDDVKARRESVLPSTTTLSPFPDFDRTLQTLSGGNGEYGGFSFNLDPKLVGDDADNNEQLAVFETETNTPFHGNYMDAFPALRSPAQQGSPSVMVPPGLPYPHNPNRSIYDPLAARAPPATPIERQSTGGSSYTGPFNPFAETNEETSVPNTPPIRHSQYPPLDDDPSRRVSRFGFARGRQGSTTRSSPLHVSSPLSNSNSDSQSFYNSTDFPQTPAQPQWTGQGRHEYGYAQPVSAMGSPLAHHEQAQAVYSQQHSRFQPFDSGVSESQLRDLIQSSRDQVNSTGFHDGPAEQGVPFKFAPSQQPFDDPAIMSASFALPVPGTVYASQMGQAQLSYGPPPGLSYPQDVSQSPAVSSTRGHETAKNVVGNGSTHESMTASPVLSLTLSSSDFPALMASPVDPSPRREEPLPTEESSTAQDTKAQEKAERKAAKKAAAAVKAAERQKVAQEKAAAKAAEKARIAQEKAAEKEKAAAMMAQQEKALKEKIEKEKTEKGKEREKERHAKEKERLAHVEMEKPSQVERDRVMQGKKAVGKQADNQKSNKRHEPSSSVAKAHTRQAHAAKLISTPTPSEPVSQVPLLSKKPKKNKPVTKPIRVPKEEENTPEESTVPSVTAEDAPYIPTKTTTVESSSNDSRAQSVDRNTPSEPTSVEELLEDIDLLNPGMDLPNHPFFDLHKINPTAKMPLEYGPLVHALSALSVGGGSFANNMPSGSIDNAVSSFQQLLETLTQTISDLLRLLPRTTWDDSSSFDGVLRDMLKGDDFLDDGGDDGPGKEDEVAALTLALERRARWMEVQLSKLEELHRDINTAAVRAVLSFNDNGWGQRVFMPRVGNTLRRFDNIGVIEDGGVVRPMTADELEKKLLVAKEAAVFAETEVREVMERMQAIKPVDVEI